MSLNRFPPDVTIQAFTAAIGLGQPPGGTRSRLRAQVLQGTGVFIWLFVASGGLCRDMRWLLRRAGRRLSQADTGY